jgi:hypothetical protein
MATLRALYVDLDGTLLGRGASLFHDGAGAVTTAGVQAIERCHRAGVEVVIYSGRREAQVKEGARLLGGRAYVFEAGAAVVDGDERIWLTHPFLPGDGATVHDRIAATGAPQRLLDAYAPALEYHDPWHVDRAVSHLFRGDVDAAAATALVAEHGLRLVDNGAIEPARRGWRAFHLVPAGVSKGRAVAVHMQRRGLAPEECIAVGDSREDLTAGEAVATFWFVANALEQDPGLAAAIAGREGVRVASAANGAGVLEAVATELAERGGG